ncbi:MAG: hypothetical protein M3014_01545 [Chloroflexota bacterium]|nr:hypothetical protein [Chloroflexota bacterium]
MNRRLASAAATFGAASMVFGAVALAQTPSPGITPTVGTGTLTPAGTASVSGTGTTSTTAVSTAATTAVTTGTVGVPSVVVPTVVIASGIYVAGGGPFAFANSAFANVYNRTDRPVKQGQVSRTYFWGPGPNTPGLIEQYNEDPTGKRQRVVQYFDKSRMELNNPTANAQQPFFVTNGLLTVELISGFIQTGEKEFIQYRASCTNMTGDFGDAQAPTYFGFQKVSNTQAGDHPAANRTGQKVTETIDRNGNTGTDASKANIAGVDIVHFEAQTKHNIPSIFWNFLNSSGRVENAQGQPVTEQLSNPWFYATGLPISEAYWTHATISGTVKDVMIQAFERRALTYVPTNPQAFQVEQANIGQHYFDWRYRNAGVCAAQGVGTPTPPVPAATATAGTAQPTATQSNPQPTTVSGSPTATGTPQAIGTAGATNTVQPVTSVTVVSTSTDVPKQSTATPTPANLITPVGTPAK